MPRVNQAHADARRAQILGAARSLFTDVGFARTSITDLVEASGLSVGAIYRYFSSKDEIVRAICEQSSGALPEELTADSIDEFLQHIRTEATTRGHARLVAQIYAEAAVSPTLADVVRRQTADLRGEVVALLPHLAPERAQQVAEAFVALCHGFSQQLAARGDLDHAPFTAALVAITECG